MLCRWLGAYQEYSWSSLKLHSMSTFGCRFRNISDLLNAFCKLRNVICIRYWKQLPYTRIQIVCIVILCNSQNKWFRIAVARLHFSFCRSLRIFSLLVAQLVWSKFQTWYDSGETNPYIFLWRTHNCHFVIVVSLCSVTCNYIMPSTSTWLKHTYSYVLPRKIDPLTNTEAAARTP